MAKKLTKEEQMVKIAEYAKFLQIQKMEKGDFGADGKIAEVKGRAYMLNGTMREHDVKCRKESKQDCTFKRNGKIHNLEFKTGCCVLSYESYELNLDECLKGVEYIAYAPEYAPTIPIEQLFHVMTREQFLEMLIAYKPSNPMTWFKFNSKRNQINLQTFVTSAKKYDYLYESLDQFPTLEEFKESF